LGGPFWKGPRHGIQRPKFYRKGRKRGEVQLREKRGNNTNIKTKK